MPAAAVGRIVEIARPCPGVFVIKVANVNQQQRIFAREFRLYQCRLSHGGHYHIRRQQQLQIVAEVDRQNQPVGGLPV
jgi:hypothetical protein